MEQVKKFMWVLLLLLPMQLMAQRFTYNYRGVDFKCRVKNGKTSILSFDNKAAKVVIPAQVQDGLGRSYPVTYLDLYSEAAFYKTNTVVIEQGITEINDLCFFLFKELDAIYIPNSIEKIGKRAFSPKHAPKFTMPSTIAESDLLAGNVVYTKVMPMTETDVLAGIDLNAYLDNNGMAQQEVETEEEAVVEKPVERTPGTSDIDFNIPPTTASRENTFCVIIANENYKQKDTPGVKYAAQDGKTFYDYCTRTLGLPRDNVRLAANASYLQMKSLLEWFSEISEVYGTDANYIVYYAGHGVPDEKGNCKLIPVDVSINDVDNGFSLKELYESLGAMTTKSALVLIDACFSGNDRANVTALNEVQRGIVREVKQEAVTGNVVVMTAASNTETALSYDDKAHGLFSYYLMKKLQETRGDVTFGDLYNYVKKEVTRRSVVVMKKKQTPSITVSNSLNNWKNMKF